MNIEIILNVSSPQIATIHISQLSTTIKKNEIVYLLFNVGFKHFTNSLSSILTPITLYLCCNIYPF